jgi:hypothetical protein
VSPVAAAVAVYVLAVFAGIVVYVRIRDSVVALYERLRWRLAERRARTPWAFAGALAGVVVVAAGLTAVLATNDYGSSRRNVAAAGASGSQIARGPLGAWLPRPPALTHSAPAHVLHRQARPARTTQASHMRRQTPVLKTTLVSEQTSSAPAVVATAAQSTGPSPLPAPNGPSAPSPLRAP